MPRSINEIVKEVEEKLKKHKRSLYKPFLEEISRYYLPNFISKGIGIKTLNSEKDKILRILAVFPSGIESKIVDYDYSRKGEPRIDFVKVYSPPDPYAMLIEAIVRGHDITQRDEYIFKFAKPLMDMLTDKDLVVELPKHEKVTLVGKEDIPLFREYFTLANRADFLRRN